MRIESLLSLVLLGSLVPGCENSGGGGSGGGGDDGELGDYRPFVGDWEQLESLQLPFADDGSYAISTLRIGGTLVGDNFANRGDVVVLYDAKPGEMVIETRKFTHAVSREEAEKDFARLRLWLADAPFDSPPRVPDLGDSSCENGMWREGCGIRVWYDGLIQPARSGMDLLVHLPPDFLAQLDITTEDIAVDDDYRRRGDVCLWNAPAGAQVDLEQGEVLLKMADDLSATPTCGAEDIAACDVAEWSTDCPCFAKGHAPSSVTIEGTKSDIAVSLPASTFTNVTLESREGFRLEGDNCVARIDGLGADLEPIDEEWKERGVIASRGSVNGALSISAFSDECGPVQHVESPDRFVADGEGDLDSRRGDITVCDGCIQNASCDDFLRDGLVLANGR